MPSWGRLEVVDRNVVGRTSTTNLVQLSSVLHAGLNEFIGYTDLICQCKGNRVPDVRLVASNHSQEASIVPAMLPMVLTIARIDTRRLSDVRVDGSNDVGVRFGVTS